MSEYSYRQKVKDGYSGHKTHRPVCLPAACERILPHKLRNETYLAYAGFAEADSDITIHKRLRNKMFITAYGMIAEDVGLDSFYDLTFEAIASEHQLKSLIKMAFQNNIALVFDIDAPYDGKGHEPYDPLSEPHAVGLAMNLDGESFRLKALGSHDSCKAYKALTPYGHRSFSITNPTGLSSSFITVTQCSSLLFDRI